MTGREGIIMNDEKSNESRDWESTQKKASLGLTGINSNTFGENDIVNLKYQGSWFVTTGKSILKIPNPLKIFVFMYKNISIYKSFYFNGPYYESQHRSHRPYFVSVQQCCQLVKIMFLSILSIL